MYEKVVYIMALLAIVSCFANAQPASCDADIDCNSKGFCRVDNLCMCDPNYFGLNCEKHYEGDGMSQANYAGTVIGGLLMMPLAFLLVFFGNKYIEKTGGCAHLFDDSDDEKDDLEMRPPPVEAPAPIMTNAPALVIHN